MTGQCQHLQALWGLLIFCLVPYISDAMSIMTICLGLISRSNALIPTCQEHGLPQKTVLDGWEPSHGKSPRCSPKKEDQLWYNAFSRAPCGVRLKLVSRGTPCFPPFLGEHCPINYPNDIPYQADFWGTQAKTAATIPWCLWSCSLSSDHSHNPQLVLLPLLLFLDPS